MAKNNRSPIQESADKPDYLLQQSAESQYAELLELASMRMPFGKYKGSRLVDLPEPYVVWFSRKGFPQGRLGRMMEIVYEIKTNGLEYLFEQL